MKRSASRPARSTRGTVCATCGRSHATPRPSSKESTEMLHLPILRWGRPYRSVDRTVVSHFRTREPFVEMSQANVGVIRRDLLRQTEVRRTLADIPIARLIELSKVAADHFQHATLPIDPAAPASQTPQD